MDEALTKAIKYMSEQMKDNPDIKMNSLIDEVSLKYDLNSLQTEFLINKFILGK